MILGAADSGLLLVFAIFASVAISAISLGYVYSVRKLIKSGGEPDMRIRGIPLPQKKPKVQAPAPQPEEDPVIEDDLNPFIKKSKKKKVAPTPEPSNGEIEPRRKWRFG